MKLSASRLAAPLAAALLLFLPAPSRAENHPVRPLQPSLDFFDSDPWRPDVYPPERAAPQLAQSVPASEDVLSARQPAAKNERWLRLVLRFLLGWMAGGAR